MVQTPQQIEQSRLLKDLNRHFHQACQQYGLLCDGDKVLIGLSGGKDSLLMTELLGAQAKIYVPRISVTAVHVRVEGRNYQSDTTYLQRFCETCGVPFTVLDTRIAQPDTDDPKSKDPCFLCAWYRRKALLDWAQAHGCNKIALGHHRDDVLTTLLMNIVYEGRCSSITPILTLDKMPIALIRPLWLIDEQDIARYAALSGYCRQTQLCPYEKNTSRTTAAELLRHLETINPDVRASLMHCLTRDIHEK